MKIAVVTSICGHLPYTAYTVAINTLYRKYYGYEFHPVHTEPDERAPGMEQNPSRAESLAAVRCLAVHGRGRFLLRFRARIESLVALMGDDFLMVPQTEITPA